MQTKRRADPYSIIRKQVREIIEKEYRTVEQFAYENGIPKSTVSRFLNGERKDYTMKSLEKMAGALKKRVVLRLE